MNPWFTYAWKAMQATGVLSFGLQSLAFFATFIFNLNIFERLGYIALWFVHGGLWANLSFITVVGYLITALARYMDSSYVGTTEMWITLAVYVVVQVGLGMLQLTYMSDTVMYMVAEELKSLCDTYGVLCRDYGIMVPEQAAPVEGADF